MRGIISRRGGTGGRTALTDNVELHEVAHLGLGAHLALVHAGVARLHVLHLRPNTSVTTTPY